MMEDYNNPIFQTNTDKRRNFLKELTRLCNIFGVDTETGIPDYILSEHIVHSLDVLNETTKKTDWYFGHTKEE